MPASGWEVEGEEQEQVQVQVFFAVSIISSAEGLGHNVISSTARRCQGPGAGTFALYRGTN